MVVNQSFLKGSKVSDVMDVKLYRLNEQKMLEWMRKKFDSLKKELEVDAHKSLLEARKFLDFPSFFMLRAENRVHGVSFENSPVDLKISFLQPTPSTATSSRSSPTTCPPTSPSLSNYT